METKAVFEIFVKENGQIGFNNLTTGAKGFEGQAKRTQSAAAELNNTFNSLKSTVMGLAGAYIGLQFIGSSENLYLGVKRAQAEIQASLQSTGAAAGVTQKQLEDSAESIYHNTT